MKSKTIFIILLLVLLVFTVYKMMQFESSIREEKKVRVYVEDESKPLMSKLPDEELRQKAIHADYYFTSNGNYFKGLKTKYLEDEKMLVWEDLFLKGVNLGVAIPGKFPAEFSLAFDEYLEWIRMIGEMNANVIRIYTILPPDFYDALAYYNLHFNNKPVYLMQGVWAEVPESEDYYDPVFVHDFEKEIIDVIDVIHGHAVLHEHAGKASGVYSTDVSRYVISILLGREWEPASVFKTNQINKIRQYNGDFICMNQGNAMEAWLAKMMDFTVLFETQAYSFQHPVSFVNWLPLDPMYHNTEIIENNRVREYDNDLESIDFMRFNTTSLFFPGVYAAYHVYPYYPDFIYLQDSYINPTDQDSTEEAYFHYLKDLKQHTRGIPLVIAEYGLPSSRGNSHFSPFGYHQGGHSESMQAKLSIALTRDIVNSSCAGAIYFEWIDEWFKHNWLVMDFEQPYDNRQFWHNMENPEENFGILALENKIKSIDGELNDWNTGSFARDRISLSCDADASYFYLASIIPGFDFTQNNLYIAIDTYDQEKGDHRLPFSDRVFEHGFEFLVEFKSEKSAFILVDEPYSVFTDIYNDHVPVYASHKNSNGNFIRQLMLTNRSRTSLTGQKTDSVVIDRSPLIFGNSFDPDFSNVDWYFNQDDKSLELRLDWHLLNVSDPSSGFVLDDQEGTSDIEYIKTDAFRIYLFVTDKNDVIQGQYPEEEPFAYTWDEWEMPVYTSRMKPVYYALQDYFKNLDIRNREMAAKDHPAESFAIAEYFGNKDGAISISFDHASFSQYQYGLPVLKRYGFSARFGINAALLEGAPRNIELDDSIVLKRLSIKEVREMAADHEILPQTAVFVRKKPGEGIVRTNHNGIPYSVLPAGFQLAELDSILKSQKHQWTILVFNHLYENKSEIPQQLDKNKAARLFMAKSEFEKQVRLLRNSNYWISSESSVFKYLRERKESSVQTERFKNMIFLKIINRLDQEIYDQPLTIEFKSNAQYISLEGSESDGTYTNRDGSFLFNVMPNKEVTIEIVE